MANNLGKIDDVDTRVVEMQFDNKQFEKGASTTLNTLEKLKQSLKFDGVEKGFDSLQKSINSVNFNNLTLQLSSTEEAFTTLAGSLKRNFFDEMSNEIIMLGKRLYNVTTGQIISGGKSRAMKIAQSKFKMEGMGVNWDQIADDLDYAVSGTAYGLDAAASIAAQLVASSVQVGDAMKTALRGVSGVAAATSSSYEEIGNVFAAVAGQGKAMAMQLNQLSLRGINAAATIGKYLGKTEAEVRDMASKGQISFEIFANAMDDAFGEHAKEANKTFTGAMSNIKAALSKIGELFYGPFYDSMIDPLNTLRETVVMFKNALTGTVDGIDTTFGLQSTSENLKQILQTLGDISNLLLKGIQNGLETSFKYLKPINTAMVSFLHNLKEVRSWLQSIVPVGTDKELKQVKDGIEGITEAEIKMAKDVWYKGTYGNGIDRVRALGEHYKIVQAYVDDFINSNYKWAESTDKATKSVEKVGEASDTVKGKLSAIVEIISAISTSVKTYILPGIKNVVTTVGTVLKTALDAATSAIFGLETRTFGFSDIIQSLAYAFFNLTKSFTLTETDVENLRKTFDGFFKLFSIGSNLITEIINRIAPLFGELKQGDSALLHITGSIGDFIGEIHRLLVTEGGIKEFFDLATDSMESFIESIDKLFGISIVDWFRALKASIKEVGSVFAEKGIREGFKFIKDNIKSIINIDTGAITNVLGKIFGTLKDIVLGSSDFFKTVSETIEEYFRLSKDIAKRIRLLIHGDIGGLIAAIDPGEAESITTRFSDAIMSVVETLTDFINKLVGKLEAQDAISVQKALDNSSTINTSIISFIKTSEKDISGTDTAVSGIVSTIQGISAALVPLIGVAGWYKAAAGINAFGSGVKAIGTALSETIGAVKTVGKTIGRAVAFEKISEGMKNIAVAAAIIAVTSIGAILALKFMDATWSDVLKGLTVTIGSLIAMSATMAILAKTCTVTGLPAMTALAVSLSLIMGEFIFLTLLFYKFADTEEHMKQFMAALFNAAITIGLVTTLLSGIATKFAVMMTFMGAISNKVTHYDASGNIKAIGDAIFDISKSVIVLVLAMFLVVKMFENNDEDYVWKAFAIMVPTIVAIGIVMGILYAALFELSGNQDAKTLEASVKLIDAVGTFIKRIILSISALMIIFMIGTSLKAGKEMKSAIGVVAAIILALAGFIWGISKTFQKNPGATPEKLGAMSKVIDSMCKFVLATTLSVGALAVVASKFGNKNVWSSVFAMVLASLGLVGGIAALLGGEKSYGESSTSTFTSWFGGLIKKQTDIQGAATQAQGITKNSIKLLNAMSIFVVAMGVSLSILTSVTGKYGEDAAKAAFLNIEGIMMSCLLLIFAMTKTDIGADKMKTASLMFLALAGAVTAISVALSILSLAIASIDDGKKLESISAAIGAIVAILGILIGALAFITSKIEASGSTKMLAAFGSVAILFAGAATIVASTAVLAIAMSKAPDAGKVAEAIWAVTILIGALGTMVLILSNIDSASTLKIAGIGVGLAAAFVALAAAMVGVAEVLKTIKKYDIDSEAIANLNSLLVVMAASVAIAMTIGAAAQGWPLLGVLAMALGLASFIGFFALFTLVDWNKVDAGLIVLASHAGDLVEVSGALLVFGVAATAIGALSLGGIAGIAALVLEIAALSAALFVLAMAIHAIKLATGDKETVNPITAFTDAFKDSKMSANATKTASNSGKTAGKAYSDGVAEGIAANSSKLVKAGSKVGEDILEGNKESLDINSPSKEGYKIGNFYAQGVMNALDDAEDPLANKAAIIGSSMANAMAANLNNVEIGAEAATNAVSGIEKAFDSVSKDDIWGDFAFDKSYGDVFEDAPFSGTIAPIIDSVEIENKKEETDPYAGITGSIGDVSGTLGELSTSFGSIFGDGGKSFMEQIRESLGIGDTGLFDEEGNLKIPDIGANITGKLTDMGVIDSDGKLNIGLPSTDDLTASISDAFNNSSITSAISNFGDTDIFAKFDAWLGTKGVNGYLGSILAEMQTSKTPVNGPDKTAAGRYAYREGHLGYVNGRAVREGIWDYQYDRYLDIGSSYQRDEYYSVTNLRVEDYSDYDRLMSLYGY